MAGQQKQAHLLTRVRHVCCMIDNQKKREKNPCFLYYPIVLFSLLVKNIHKVQRDEKMETRSAGPYAPLPRLSGDQILYSSCSAGGVDPLGFRALLAVRGHHVSDSLGQFNAHPLLG